MLLENFWYTYKNILLRAIYKKKYLTFIRKIFGTLYKFLRKFYLNIFSSNIINLDKLGKQKFKNQTLDKLFISFNCDKGSHIIFNNKKIITHKYSTFYNKYLAKIKKKKLNILELGSHEGKSIASFYYFFPNANFVGANINPFQMKYMSSRIKELYVDVNSEKILNNLANHLNINFDLIIDDASHNLKDILTTLPIFFKKLKKNGFYVIEDIDQFKVFKELNPTNDKLTPLKILHHMKKNKKFNSKYLKKEDVVYLRKNIKKYYFEKGKCIINRKNISDIVFLQKK
jgi:hypothetical protein